MNLYWANETNVGAEVEQVVDDVTSGVGAEHEDELVLGEERADAEDSAEVEQDGAEVEQVVDDVTSVGEAKHVDELVLGEYKDAEDAANVEQVVDDVTSGGEAKHVDELVVGDDKDVEDDAKVEQVVDDVASGGETKHEVELVADGGFAPDGRVLIPLGGLNPAGQVRRQGVRNTGSCRYP